MVRKKQPGTAVRISDKAHKQLKRLVDASGRSQSVIFDTLIDMAVVHDLLKKDWQDRLNAALRSGMWQLEIERRASEKDRCDGLRGADQKWKCIVGRKNKTPLIRILAEKYSEALDLCEGCEVTLAPILQNEEYVKQIRMLKQEIQIKHDMTFKVPICHKGATLNEDGTEFSGCPKNSARTPVSVASFCKVYTGGLPCMLFAERVIGVGNKLKD